MRRAETTHRGGCGCSDPASPAAETCYCTVEELVHAISRKHALTLMNRVGDGPCRFHELEEAVSGISTSTLADTLRELCRVGLVSRRQYPEIPPRVEYTLTEAGRLLRDRFHALLDRVREVGGEGA